MEVNTKTSVLNAEPLKLLDKLSDDWVQPFACNHVIINISQEGQTGKKTKDYDVIAEKAVCESKASYCIMCGELVLENIQPVEKRTSVGDFHKEHRRGSESPKDNQAMFGSFRTLTSAMSHEAPSSNVRACTIHGHKKVKYFCEDHQEICCSVCVNVLHRGCQRILLIKDEIKSGWSEQICQETISALESISKSFRHIIDHCASLREQLNRQVDEFRKRRDDLKSRLLSLLENFVKSSEKKLTKFLNVKQKELDSTLQTCRNALQQSESSIDVLQRSLKSNSLNETFIATQKVLHQREKYGAALFTAISGSRDISIGLVLEKDVENFEKLKKIGHIQFLAESAQFPESVISAVSKLPKSEVRSPRTAPDARSESVSSLKDPVSLTGEFNVRLPEDKNTCEIVGATFLKDGRVAIVDLKNRKLKVFDSKFSQASAVSLTSDPRDVTEVSPQEVAVSLPDESKVQFISTGKSLHTTRSVLTTMPCYGITCHNQDLVILCDDGFSTTAVQTIDFDGKIVRNIKTNRSGKVLLKSPWNLSMSVDGQQICVTDKGRLVNFDRRGNILFQYYNEKLENPRGLATDETGKFYVCGTGSNNVHQISPDGKLIDMILSEQDIRAPQAVCYQVEKRNLLITCVGNDHVFLYKLAKP